MKVIWSPLAIERLSEVVDYIALDRPMAAEKWALGAFDRVEQLETFPDSGRTVPEVGRTDIRELIYGKYRIIYGIKGDEISILTVRHCRQLLDENELS